MQAQYAPIGRFLILSAAFVIVVAGMRAAEPILVPFLLSVFIAVIFSPPLAWLKKRGVPNGLSICIVIIVIIFAGLIMGYVVGKSVSDFRSDIPLYGEKLATILDSSLNGLIAMGAPIDGQMIKDIINPGAALNLAGNILTSFSGVMTNAFMILLTTIFILAEEVGFSDKFRYAYRDSRIALDAIGKSTASINRYMAIKFSLSLLTGVLAMIWLIILGVDYFVLWGLLAFLLNFVPTLGSIIAAVPAVLLALVQLGPTSAALTALGYVVVNVGVSNVLEPRITGKGLGLSTLVVFLSLVFWGWALGPVGMLLSVPLTMTIKIVLESFEDTQWLGVMLGTGKQAAASINTAETVAIETHEPTVEKNSATNADKPPPDQ